MVSAPDLELDSGSGSLGRGTALCSWARHLTLIVPLSTQYKWVPAKLGLEDSPTMLLSLCNFLSAYCLEYFSCFTIRSEMGLAIEMSHNKPFLHIQMQILKLNYKGIKH